jgi:hypothetical protein
MPEFLQWEEKLIKIIINNSRDFDRASITISVVSDNSEDLINSEIRIPKIQQIQKIAIINSSEQRLLKHKFTLKL